VVNCFEYLVTDAGLKEMFARVLEKKNNYRGVQAAAMKGKHYCFRVVDGPVFRMLLRRSPDFPILKEP
jgi:hypothetical protein